MLIENMDKEHHYKLTTKWHGNKGTGTSGLRDYDRSHTVTIQGKPELHLTTDNPAVGDKSKLNPEDCRFFLPHAFLPVCVCFGRGGSA